MRALTRGPFQRQHVYPRHHLSLSLSLSLSPVQSHSLISKAVFMFRNIYVIKSLAFFGLVGLSLFLILALMETPPPPPPQTAVQKDVYSVWAVPPEEVGSRVKKLMDGLRGEFGGPQFEPHITVVGAIKLTADDAAAKFRSACQGLRAYNATVDRVAAGSFFYQCVYLLIHPTPQVVEASSHCTGHFGYENSTPYMPHLSILYQDLTEDEKKKAQEKANALDESINQLSFPITRLALYKTDPEDKTLKSWEKIAECTLET